MMDSAGRFQATYRSTLPNKRDSTMANPPDVDPKLIEAFHLMWGRYPAPASLVHKSKWIVAVNQSCRQGGREPGMICATWNRPEIHRGCLAARTLREQTPLSKLVRIGDVGFKVYWLPIDGYPDFYVHFATESERMADDPTADGCDCAESGCCPV